MYLFSCMVTYAMSLYISSSPVVILNKGLEDSVIVGNNAAQLEKLYGWLEGATQLGTTQWKLCWRASQDGWASSTFHSKCDHKGPTVTIIKVDKYIFGGYTSVSWGELLKFLYNLSTHQKLY